MADNGWIGVDLDGTLAVYDGWHGIDHIGAPIPTMVARVREWLENGQEVRIFTARIASGEAYSLAMIEDWCAKNLGRVLPVTATKDFRMIELWDDRCVRVVTNTGERCCG